MLRTNDRTQTPAEQPQEVPQRRKSIFRGFSSSGGNYGDQLTDSNRVTTAKTTKDDQAAGTAPSPQAPDKASKKRSAVVEASEVAVSGERNMAKRVKTADQKSPLYEEGVFGRASPNVRSLQGKDDVASQEALGQLGPGGI